MNTTIAVRKDFRDQASARAKQEGLPLSVITNLLLSQYASGKITINAQVTSQSEPSLESFVKGANHDTHQKLDPINQSEFDYYMSL